MRASAPFVLTLLTATLSLSTCSQVRITHSEAAAESESLVADLTLGVFLDLASLQINEPAMASRLLATDPREPSKTLGSLGARFEAYQQQLAETAKVRPLMLFLAHDADPAAAAKRYGLTLDSWPPLAPPALLAGPEVDTLIVFEPLNSARNEPGRGDAVARVQIASLSTLTSLSLAASGPQGDVLDRRLYRVNPRDWKKSVVFEHTRCGRYPRPESAPEALVTKLIYQGGVTEFETTPLNKESWKPCSLVRDEDLWAVTVKQKSNWKKAGRPVIIAASYFQDPKPGPLLADWIRVQ